PRHGRVDLRVAVVRAVVGVVRVGHDAGDRQLLGHRDERGGLVGVGGTGLAGDRLVDDAGGAPGGTAGALGVVGLVADRQTGAHGGTAGALVVVGLVADRAAGRVGRGPRDVDRDRLVAAGVAGVELVAVEVLDGQYGQRLAVPAVRGHGRVRVGHVERGHRGD